MPLIIQPGFLPSDNTRINVNNVLDTFVLGTRITNFGSENFDGSVSFVLSATDPPSSNFRNRGTMWFRRGEGKLYKWTLQPMQSPDWSPSEIDVSTGITNGFWVSMSDRKDMLVQLTEPAAFGDLLHISHTVSDWRCEISEDAFPRYSLRMGATTPTEDNPNRIEPTFIVDPIMVCQTDTLLPGGDGIFRVVTDWGFTQARVAGPGASLDGPTWGMVDINNPQNILTATGHSAWTNTATHVAFISESGASSADALRQVFLMPSITNLVKP